MPFNSAASLDVALPVGLNSYQSLPVFPASAWSAKVDLPVTHGSLRINEHTWRPGDVLLFCDIGGLIDPIQTYQMALFRNAQIAQWTHAALYAGDGVVWDIWPGAHVRITDLNDHLTAGRRLHLRRLIGAAPSASSLQYAYQGLKATAYPPPKTIKSMFKGRLLGASALPPDAGHAVCSTFVQRVLFHAAGVEPLPGVTIATPADFANSGDFRSIPLSWGRP